MSITVDRRTKRGASKSKMLWHQGDWRCEYIPKAEQGLGGTISLYLGRALVAQQDTECLVELLNVARRWRDSFAEGGAAAPRKVAWALAPDRRRGPQERRGSRRGGRRRGDVE